MLCLQKIPPGTRNWVNLGFQCRVWLVKGLLPSLGTDFCHWLSFSTARAHVHLLWNPWDNSRPSSGCFLFGLQAPVRMHFANRRTHTPSALGQPIYLFFCWWIEQAPPAKKRTRGNQGPPASRYAAVTTTPPTLIWCHTSFSSFLLSFFVFPFFLLPSSMIF